MNEKKLPDPVRTMVSWTVSPGISLLGSFFLSFSFLIPAFGQDQRDSVDLPEVEIVSDKVSPSSSFKVSELDPSTLENSEHDQLGQLLSEHSPLFIKQYGVSGISSVSFRGTGSDHTRLYWNGLPLRSPSLGQMDLSLFPAFFLDQAEIHHGSGSLIDGPGGLGGSIHLNSGMDESKALRTRLTGKGGSFGERSLGADIGLTKGPFSSRSRVLYQASVNDFSYPDITQEGNPIKTREHAQKQLQGLLQELGYEIGNGHQVTGRLWYLECDRNIPAPITQVERKQHQFDRSFRSMLGWNMIGSDHQLSFRSGFFDSELQFDEELSKVESRTHTQAWRNTLRFKKLFSEGRKLRAGLSFDRESVVSSGYDGKKTRDRVGGFISMEQSLLDRLVLNGLVREEFVGGEPTPLMPSVGFDLLAVKSIGLHWKGDWGKVFKVPDFNDIYWEPGGNPDLRPEEGWTLESGLLLKLPEALKGFTGKVEVTAYYSRSKDKITWVPTGSGYWSPMNQDRSQGKGMEVDLHTSVNLAEEWELGFKGTYGYNRAEIVDEDDDINGSQAMYVPFHQGNGSVSIEWKEKNRIRYRFSYTGKRFIDQENTTYMPAIPLHYVGAERSFDLAGHMSLKVSGGIRNLFDVPYQVVAWRPMPGRSFELRVEYRFDRQKW